MEKAKKYDWKDSNMALFGSDIEKNIKRHSAESEPAWQGTGQIVELRVWRINKFKVEKWSKTEYGKFYTGDSYIILNTYKLEGEDDLKMDVHFWIGKYSTQDEYATAAYKTVELDNFHKDVPVQHREVQDYESTKFKTYFQFITYLDGGCDTGFRNVGLDSYQPRLLWISTGKTKNKTEVRERPCIKGSLNDEDSFILDKGSEILLFHGAKANLHEKNQSNQYSHELESSRKGKARVVVVDELASLVPDGEMKQKQIASYSKADDKIYKLSDASGKMELTLVDTVDLTKSILTSDDIFYIDNGAELFIWCGKNASVDERRESLMTATKYLNTTNHPFAPIEIVKQGKESVEFWALFTD